MTAFSGRSVPFVAETVLQNQVGPNPEGVLNKSTYSANEDSVAYRIHAVGGEVVCQAIDEILGCTEADNAGGIREIAPYEAAGIVIKRPRNRSMCQCTDRA